MDKTLSSIHTKNFCSHDSSNILTCFQFLETYDMNIGIINGQVQVDDNRNADKYSPWNICWFGRIYFCSKIDRLLIASICKTYRN